MAAKTRTIYRDTRNGQFAKKSSWQRSKAHGGTRFKRERIKAAPPSPLAERFEDEWEEWAITFSYGEDE